MAITHFYHFIVTYANATQSAPASKGNADRVYHLVESPQQHWTISENAQPLALTVEQHSHLVHLLAALQPLPDPTIAPELEGADGTWITFVVLQGDQQTSYRWWLSPPTPWHSLGAITHYVEQLADLPRTQAARQQREIMQQFFNCLIARDLPGMLTHYHADIQYRHPFFTLQGAAVGAMWRWWWRYLPDLQVAYEESGLRNGFLYWTATYTYPPTGRRVTQHMSTTLHFAEGAIVEQVDTFNVHEWSAQAYGFAGGVLGGRRLWQWWIARKMRTQFDAFLS